MQGLAMLLGSNKQPNGRGRSNKPSFVVLGSPLGCPICQGLEAMKKRRAE